MYEIDIRAKTKRKLIIQIPRKINNTFVIINDECCSVFSEYVCVSILDLTLYFTTPFVNKTPKMVKSRTNNDKEIRKSGARRIDFALNKNLNDDVNKGLIIFNLRLI